MSSSLLHLFMSRSSSSLLLYLFIRTIYKSDSSFHFCLFLLFPKHIVILQLLPSSSFSLHLFIFNFQRRELITQTMARDHICWSNLYCLFFKHNYLCLHCPLHLFIFFTSSAYLTIVNYWGIGHDVMLTKEYQCWPQLHLGQYWYSLADITSCPMPQ